MRRSERCISYVAVQTGVCWVNTYCTWNNRKIMEDIKSVSEEKEIQGKNFFHTNEGKWKRRKQE